MLPVCHCSSGLLRSLRGIAAITWIAALLHSPPVYASPANNDAPHSALNSSAYPRITMQPELHEIVSLFKGDWRLISLITEGRTIAIAEAATLAFARARGCRDTKPSYRP